MNSISQARFFVLSAILAFFAFFIMAVAAYPATYTISPGQSIPSAATSGDTVVFKAGTYPMQTITKAGLELRSETNGAARVEGFVVQADGTVLDGFDVTHGRTSGMAGGVYVDASNVTLRNSYVHGISHYGVQGTDRASNVRLLNNGIYLCEQLVIVKGAGWIVEGNDIFRPKLRAIGWDDADYVRIWGRGHVVRRNHIHGARRSEIRDSHTDCFQMFFGPLQDVLVEDNFMQGFDEAFMLETVAGDVTTCVGVVVRNNVMVGTLDDDSGRLVRGGDGMPLPMGAWGFCGRGASATGTGGIRGVQFYNNTVAYVELYGFGNRDDGTGFDLNNIYYRVGRPRNGTSNSPSNLQFGFDVIFGYDVYLGPSGTGDLIGVNPQLADPKNPLGADGLPMTADDGLRLASGSPAINSGTAITGLVADILGAPRDSQPDRGAYEFAATAPAPTPTPTPTPEPTPTPTPDYQSQIDALDSRIKALEAWRDKYPTEARIKDGAWKIAPARKP